MKAKSNDGSGENESLSLPTVILIESKINNTALNKDGVSCER